MAGLRNGLAYDPITWDEVATPGFVILTASGTR